MGTYTIVFVYLQPPHRCLQCHPAGAFLLPVLYVLCLHYEFLLNSSSLPQAQHSFQLQSVVMEVYIDP